MYDSSKEQAVYFLFTVFSVCLLLSLFVKAKREINVECLKTVVLIVLFAIALLFASVLEHTTG